jgi:hypothetical protein
VKVIRNIATCLACAVIVCFGQALAAGSHSDHQSTQESPPSLLATKLSTLAGENATFCGEVAFGQSSKAADKCASQAIKKKRAFYVVYDHSGLTERPKAASGLARNAAGMMCQVAFASEGFLSVPAAYMPRAELSDGSTIWTRPCPRPYRVHQFGGGGVTQEWPPKKPPAGLTCFPLFK